MLVGRTGPLEALRALSLDALGGQGRLVFVGGEAGVGKSALIRAFAEERRGEMRVRVGAVDNVTTADAFAAFADAVPELAAISVEGRIALLRALREMLVAEPTVLVLEDLHWADQATLDALRYLGRRLDEAPLLIVATYRYDEVGPRHPLAAAMGELAGESGVVRLVVEPLTLPDVIDLAARAGSAIDPVTLHVRTGGNAFYVTESLSTGSDAVPRSVQDAVLARIARLSAAAGRVAAAQSVLGTVEDPELLTLVADQPSEAIDECVEAGVLIETPLGLGFRHELARAAVEASLAPIRRRQLNARALQVLLERTPHDHRALAHHAHAAGDLATARMQAALAARRAARLGAHREAVAQLQVALRLTGDGDPDRAGLLEELSYECYLTDQHQEALIARQRAMEIHEVAGDARRVGDSLRWLSRLAWFLGRGADAESYAARAVAKLEPLGASHELAYAYSTVAQLGMLAGDAARTELWGRRALELAAELGDEVVRIHALNNLGSVALESGRVDAGVELVEESLRLAVEAGEEEHAARAYCNLSSAQLDFARIPEGVRLLDEGIAYCEGRDLDSWSRYMESWRTVALADADRWDEATQLAGRLLAFPDIAAISSVQAAATSAVVAARRGIESPADIEVAMRTAEGIGVVQRVAVAAAAAAEMAWLAGRLDEVISVTDRALVFAAPGTQSLALSKIGWWRTLAGADQGSEPLPPFDLMREGEWAAAADAWLVAGAPTWAAYALALSPDSGAAERSIGYFESMGATPVVEAVLRTRRERGLELPRRPRPATRANPASLTARELEVLGLLALGGSTAEIASRLVLSPKTVEHHIGAILRKLSSPTRARAVAEAHRLGLVAS